jgi:hypothetical protein
MAIGAQSASALLRFQFRLAHGLLGTSTRGLTVEVAACHAQAVLREDLTINGFIAVRKPLALSTWRGRTGCSELPRLGAPIDWRTWARRVRFDAPEFRSYAHAVFAATDAYLELDHSRSTTCLLNALLFSVLTGARSAHLDHLNRYPFERSLAARRAAPPYRS